MKQDVLISKYIIRFSITFAAILVGCGIIFSLLGIDAGSSLTIIAQMSACSFVISTFIKNHKRLPIQTEKTKLIWYSFLASWAVSIALFIIAYLLDPTLEEALVVLQSLGFIWVAVIILFVSLLQFGITYFSYSFLGRKQFEAMQKKGMLNSEES